jgi:hypothetical protein
MRTSYVRFNLIALAAIFLMPALAAAQPGVGLKGGLSLSRLATDPDVPEDTLSTLTDFSAGAFVVLSDSPLTAQIEALVTRRGTSLGGDVFGLLPGDFLGLDDLVKIRLTYLDLSAFLRAQAGSGANHVYVFGGPTVGVKLKSELVVPFLTQEFDAATEDFDLALAGGIGVEANHIVLEGRYTHGLRDIIPAVDAFGAHVRHRSASILVGVRF